MQMAQQSISAPPKIWITRTKLLISELVLVALCGKDWLVKFSMFKTKLVMSNHHQSDPELSPIMIDECSLKNAPCLKCLLVENLLHILMAFMK